MPTPCYISITGQTQGTSLPVLSPQILSAISTCRDTKMKCWCRSFCITLLFQPIHSLVNLPGSAHKPFIFTVALNKAVPLLYNALASGEMLPKVELHWWRTSVEGKQEHYFTTRLTDATIVDMNLHMPHCQDPAQREFTQLLAVSLAYRKVEWEHIKSGTSGADDWRAPLEA